MAVTEKIAQAQQTEVNVGAIAIHIQEVSKVGRILANSKLKQKAILVLLSNYTGLPQRDIKIVLDALPQLEREYLK